MVKAKRNHCAYFLCLTLMLICMSVIFPIGVINSTAKIEKIANYLGEVASEGTIDASCLGLSVVSNIDVPQTQSAKNLFKKTYGVFGETVANYVSVYDSHKKHNISFADSPNENCLVINTDDCFDTIDYLNHYKHSFYPVETLFPSAESEDNDEKFIWISRGKARTILANDFSEKNEEKIDILIGHKIGVLIDGEEKQYSISNVFLDDNYYFDALRIMSDEFIFIHDEEFVNGFLPDHIFFLRNRTFVNYYFLRFAFSSLPIKTNNYFILDYNLKSDYIISEDKVAFHSITSSRDALSMSLVIVVLAIYVFCYLFGLRHIIGNVVIGRVLYALVPIIPLLLFWIIYLITNEIMLFSLFSILASFLVLLIHFTLCLIFFRNSNLYKRSQA